MPLSPGQKLGHYEIVEPIGAGGMGEVYRARDPRLGRDVAVKVLPESVSMNAEVRARFEREAKTISALNHPHICVLHDIGSEDGTDFLVMELIDGETLADRLTRGPLPTDDVLKFGAQIADALDRAHRAGVVHRDLKPGNIMITRSGAKLMDFGLARVTGPGSGGLDKTVAQLSESPTEAQPLTAEGTIVGTFQYMAPEQLEGADVDERADLWALGCVLYEMATGRRAFEGKSQASLIGAIMHAEPAPVSQVVALAPPQLDRLVTACLAKDSADRVQSAHDLKLQLEWISAGDGSAAAPVPAARRGMGSWARAAVVAIVAAVATAAVMALLFRGDTVPLPEPQRYILGSAALQPASAPALSPDERYVVFSVEGEVNSQLYRRDLTSFSVTPIPGTEDGVGPFFSPDGAWIGFCTTGAIKKVPAAGGVAQLVASYQGANAGVWSDDGFIYFTVHSGGQDGRTALARTRDTGGAIEVLTQLDADAGESEAWLPEILPDGRTTLISVLGGPQGSSIMAVKPDGTRKTVAESAFLGRYVDSGYLLYRDDDSRAVLAAPFDPAALEITGPAVPITEEVDASYCYDVGDRGKLVYIPVPGAGAGMELVWIDRNGEARPATDTRAAWAQPRIGPDGHRIVVRKVGSNCELWLVDTNRGSIGRLFNGDDSHDPLWSPDGTHIAFRRQLHNDMVTLTVGGGRKIVPIPTDTPGSAPRSWSAGGNLLAYAASGPGTRSDVWVMEMDGTSDPVAYLASEFSETLPTISPDGNWIAYVSDETGSREVFIRTYPDDGTAIQVSVGGGNSPLWSRDGRELFYVDGSAMMAVPIETDSDIRLGTAVKLFEGGFNTDRARDFDVGPDGRFIVTRRVGGGEGLQELRVLVHWQQEIDRLGSAGH